MKGHDICIFAVGAQTALGRSAPACAAAVRAGITRAQEHPTWQDADAEPVVVHRARWLDLELTGAPRLLALAIDAALEALPERLPAPLGVYVGMPELRPGLTPALLEAFQVGLHEALGARGELLHVTLLPTGHASGVAGLEQARQSLSRGQETLALVGGVDSYLHPETLRWLDEQHQLHSLENAWGMAPGEGAGFCLLASQGQERLLQHPPLARLRAVSLSQEPHPLKSRAVCTGDGLTRAFHAALESLRGEKIDQLLLDLNGEIYRSEELGFASVRTQEHFVALDELLTPALSWGDVGAASAPLFVSLAVQAAQRGWSRGPRWLLSTSSEGGLRGVVLLELETPSRLKT